MAVRALPMARALARRGHSVKMVVPPWSHAADAGRSWDDEAVGASLRIENTTISPHIRISLELARRARDFRPDVIHLFKPKGYSGLAHWELHQLRRVRGERAALVLDTDDWEGVGGWNELEAYSSSQKRFFAWQERWGLTHSDAVTVASRALETITWSLGTPRDRVVYVPNGVNSLPPSDGSPAEVRARHGLGTAPVILLYTRFFEFEMARLVRLLGALFERAPEAKLMVVGTGLFGEEETLRAEAARRDWLDRIVFAGWIPPEQLRAYFGTAGAAIYPFDDTLVNRCKCAVKLIDLLAAGVPVVADAVGQNTEYITHDETGLLAPSGGDRAFVAATVQLLADPTHARRLGQCASDATERNYSWEVLAERVLSAYVKSLSSSSRVGT
jgi:glycosyltransferase involved in cell wall biosynthesis